MSERTSSPDTRRSARVYSEPNAALEHARATLSSASATDADRAAALLTLGRSAYYANRMSDAVGLLRRAAELATSPEVLTDVLLMLAPALSKEGHPSEALALLENPALSLEPGHAGQLRNQRGIILTELGRLPEAITEMTAALDLLSDAGDGDREARTLVNLGAVSSMMGRLDDAEHWYSRARELTIATGQHVVAAGIEGNLGYVESRRGNFSRALEWYRGARQTFAGFGDVGLLVAVLEIDHARTLLDVGLAADAVEAAERACGSAAAGGNQMLETQGRLLLAEALVDVGDRRAAAEALARGDELAHRLGQGPWQLRATALRAELDDVLAAERAGSRVDREIDEFLAAGWVREAFEHALVHATAGRETDPSGARALLRQIDARAAEVAVDPVRRAHAALLVAEIDDDVRRLHEAFDDALERLAEQRDLMASIEMRATLAGRIRPIRDVAIRAALRADRPADAVLDVLERTRAIRQVRRSPSGAPGEGSSLLAELRSARVALDEAKLGGGDVVAADEHVRALERRILDERRSIVGLAGGVRPERPGRVEIPDDTAYVTFAVLDDRVIGVRLHRSESVLSDVGPVSSLAPLVRAQRTALRHLADGRRAGSADAIDRLRAAAERLDAQLLVPLDVGDAERVVLTPPGELHQVAWAALPSLVDRPLSLTPTLDAWSSDVEAVTVRGTAFLGGPRLATGGRELGALGRLWRRPGSVMRRASCASALAALQTADLVHIAAHGSFRSDNPFFSALEFEDGQLALLEIAELDVSPAVVVLASCDAAQTALLGDDVAIGTAAELRRIGAHAVVAPAAPVSDDAAASFFVDLHDALARGVSVDEAMVRTRRGAVASGDRFRLAAGSAIHLLAGRSSRRPIGAPARI